MPSAMPNKSRARTSRVSSPLVRTTNASSTSTSWVEPGLQDGKPSYEDHGGHGFGVLEDMQPLGSRPNAKVKARVKAEPLRKSLGKNAALPQEMQDTPEGTPAYEPPRASPPAPGHASPQLVPVVDNDQDQDYQPRVGKRQSRARQSKGTATPNETPKPVTASLPSQPPSNKGRPRSTSAVKVQESEREHKIPNLGAIVEKAHERAIEVGNPVLGRALQQIYHESFDNDRLTYLLQAILEHRATEEDNAEFRKNISRAKKIVRASDKAHRKSQDAILVATNGARKALAESPAKPKSPVEAAPRPSIEGSGHAPKLKISIRRRSPKTTAPSETTQVNSKKRSPRKRANSGSSSSSLSSFTSQEAEPMDVDGQEHVHVDQQPPKGGQSDSNKLRVSHSSLASSMKRSSADAELESDERDRILTLKKQKLHETLYREPPPYDSVAESRIRPVLDAPRALRQPGHPKLQAPTGGRAPRENGQPVAEPGSPLSDLSSPPSSRGSTPLLIEPPSRMTKKKAKTKQSPAKKQRVNVGAEGNGSGGRESPIGTESNAESDNNDYCTSCGGSGFLLCCDGCDRAFHFTCLDPPLTADASELDEPWFCHKCVAKRERAEPQKNRRGLFAQLFASLEHSNPTNYLLPAGIREHFEGVTTSKDGKFADPPSQKTRSRAGYDEPLDLLKTKDGKGNAVLCYSCGKSAAGRREIITCDLCGYHWHLDCTNPPLANPPFRDQWNRKARDWLCPLHVEHDLREMDPARVARQRSFYMRRPRGAKIIETSLRRGFVNNGIIEVADDSSSDEEHSEFEDTDSTASSTIYRLPAKGIKLDFIDRVKHTRIIQDSRSIRHTKSVRVATPDVRRPYFTKRPFLEKKTALSLVQFASQNNDLDLSGDQVDNLVGTLIAEAPSEVVKQLTAAETAMDAMEDKKPLSEQQREELQRLQELIRRKLGS